jgi:uncharacterized SAM-binding protein YcdF (DUF218 family)
VEWAREDLVDKGVLWDDIVILEHTKSGSIYDALNTREYVLAGDDIRSLLVVTSDYHTRRTLWNFQCVFDGEPVQVGVYPAVPKQQANSYRTGILVKELVKLFYYKLKYRQI